MSAPTVAETVLVSRHDLTAPDAGGPGALVAAATARLRLAVDGPELGRTVDGWLGPEGLVWHVDGDQDTPRAAFVAPASHLAASVARMVDLGPRDENLGEDITATVDGIRAAVDWYRMWTFGWAAAGREGGFAVLDQGPGSWLWAVTEREGAYVRLHRVTPAQVWERLVREGRHATDGTGLPGTGT